MRIDSTIVLLIFFVFQLFLQDLLAVIQQSRTTKYNSALFSFPLWFFVVLIGARSPGEPGQTCYPISVLISSLFSMTSFHLHWKLLLPSPPSLLASLPRVVFHLPICSKVSRWDEWFLSSFIRKLLLINVPDKQQKIKCRSLVIQRRSDQQLRSKAHQRTSICSFCFALLSVFWSALFSRFFVCPLLFQFGVHLEFLLTLLITELVIAAPMSITSLPLHLKI